MRALAAAVVLLAALPAGAAGRDRCNRPDVRTVALTPLLRVYQEHETGNYRACLRRTGRRTLLWADDGLYTTGSIQAVAGRFVVFTVDYVPECKADCPPGVTGRTYTAVTDARSRRTRWMTDGRVWDLDLDLSGAVSWCDAEGAHALASI